jgi:exopolysaccharide biosynthesis polyprenyl glycosylphosphotransferase
MGAVFPIKDLSMSKNAIVFWWVFLPSLLLMYLGLYLSVIFRYGPAFQATIWLDHVAAFSPIYLLWLVVFFVHGVYDLRAFRRHITLMFSLLSAMLVNILVAVVYFYFQPDLILTPRRFLLINAGLVLLLVLGWMLIVKYVLKNRLNYPVFAFSPQGRDQQWAETIEQYNFLGYKFAGWLDESSLKEASIPRDSLVVFSDVLKLQPESLKLLYRLRKAGAKFYNHRDFFEDLLRRVHLSDISEAWFLENVDYQHKRVYLFLKRGLDLAFGVVGFIAFLINWPICASLIKLTSKGPVLFVQERVGKDNKIFKVYKYRTMAGGATNTWTHINDPRITKIGKFLRKSRIDELPQFINLLLGNMSLVGPRPEQSHLVEELSKKLPFYEERHLVKPGITGWAQINNIYAGSVEETALKLQYDLYYIKHRSLLFDLEIILKTLYYIFTWRGR